MRHVTTANTQYRNPLGLVHAHILSFQYKQGFLPRKKMESGMYFNAFSQISCVLSEIKANHNDELEHE